MNKSISHFHKTLLKAPLALAVVLFFALAGTAAAEKTTQQTFVLQPGWNSIFLELVPEVADTEAAFAGLPIESVWAFNPSLSTLDFVQDPVDLVLDLPGWLHYVPAPRPEALLNNLFMLQVNKAYLIHLNGGAPVTWTVVGQPSLSPVTWQTDAFTLTGFRVDQAGPPTLASYLAPSAAHTGQPIYQLDASGIWQLVLQPNLTSIRSGEAYWVYTHGASTYQGPLEVSTPSIGGIDFGGQLDQETLIVRNATLFDTSLQLRRLDSASAVPLYHRAEAGGILSWQALPSPLVVASVAGQEHLIQFGVKRTELPLPRVESILEIKNGLGARVLVPVAASAASVAASSFAGSSASGGAAFGDEPASPYAHLVRAAATADLSGLWVGDVEVNKVSEAQTGGTTPTKTGKGFKFRVLLHVDGSGQVRLLKEVIQMWQNGTRVPSPTDPGFTVVGQRGRYVLLTDDALIPNFQGASLRDGVPVGIRLSTAAYDFPGNEMNVVGAFGPGQALSWTLQIDPNSPTNPFRHKFHPDHDNLDENFIVFREEAFSVHREMRLELAASAPGGASLGWGSTEINGVFKEKISGLHHNPIYVEGTFELKRSVLTPVLNQ